MKKHDTTERDAKSQIEAVIPPTSEKAKTTNSAKELTDEQISAVIGGTGMPSGKRQHAPV